MKLTKVQKVTRFIVYKLRDLLVVSMITGILPTMLLGQIYQILNF